MSSSTKTIALSATLLLALATHLAVHVAIAIHLGRTVSWTRGLLAFVLPPLAPLWSWRAGSRRLTYAWAGSLALYAAGVAVA